MANWSSFLIDINHYKDPNYRHYKPELSRSIAVARREFMEDISSVFNVPIEHVKELGIIDLAALERVCDDDAGECRISHETVDWLFTNVKNANFLTPETWEVLRKHSRVEGFNVIRGEKPMIAWDYRLVVNEDEDTEDYEEEQAIAYAEWLASRGLVVRP